MHEGTKAFLKGRKPGLVVNLSQFFYSLIQTRIRIPNTNLDPDPGQPNQFGSRSTTLTLVSTVIQVTE